MRVARDGCAELLRPGNVAKCGLNASLDGKLVMLGLVFIYVICLFWWGCLSIGLVVALIPIFSVCGWFVLLVGLWLRGYVKARIAGAQTFTRRFGSILSLGGSLSRRWLREYLEIRLQMVLLVRSACMR
jgi:hypothetical protein